MQTLAEEFPLEENHLFDIQKCGERITISPEKLNCTKTTDGWSLVQTERPIKKEGKSSFHLKVKDTYKDGNVYAFIMIAPQQTKYDDNNLIVDK